MAAPHHAARAILEKFRDEIAQVYPELVSLVAYGSAVGEHFREGRSNVNLLLVLPRVDASVLARGAALLKKHREKSRIVPLLLSEKEFRDSVDVFAIEFSDIRERHALLLGLDLFDGLIIPGTWMRHQCEFELRAKLLRLRQGYLECEGREKHLQALLAQVLSGVLPLARALLRLAGEQAPHSPRDLITALARRYGISEEPWLEAQEIKEKSRRRGARGAAAVYPDFLESLASLVGRVNDAS